jgi:hypothetical protein
MEVSIVSYSPSSGGSDARALQELADGVVAGMAIENGPAARAGIEPLFPEVFF